MSAPGSPGTASPTPRASAEDAKPVAPGASAPEQPPLIAPRTPPPAVASGGRVMIGTAAVQARDDEPWFEGAARAALAAQPTPGSTAEVVIASSEVRGRVTRSGHHALRVHDREGITYELAWDARSRVLDQGRPVHRQRLARGMSVRARFVLVGDRAIARDIQVER
ncbi:hypothetical protein [Citreicoccus inhibens]|uniref:hypothetical protein n=1 Tax=Citreicoccus inhibens TaxID=2849499 RepID=UPI001EF02059|nr:hypothetical protein [Citreicoccus inhibens]